MRRGRLSDERWVSSPTLYSPAGDTTSVSTRSIIAISPLISSPVESTRDHQRFSGDKRRGGGEHSNMEVIFVRVRPTKFRFAKPFRTEILVDGNATRFISLLMTPFSNRFNTNARVMRHKSHQQVYDYLEA